MASRRKAKHGTRSPDRQADDHGTRSGQPNPEDVPSHPSEHKSGYGGEGSSPRTSTDQRETHKRS
jgi:hypothetical protein